ncbi:MAG: glycosyl transferase family 4, partial [Gammaproteobacteria bacterium]
ERSLNLLPTPRGGGLAISFVAGVAHLLVAVFVVAPAGSAIIAFVMWTAAALGFAALGWMDDRQPRPARLRLVVQLLLAAAFVAAVGVAVPPTFVIVSAVAAVVTIVAIVWVVNVYNFMDGADGFAALQALLTLGGALLIPGVVLTTPVALLAAVLAGAAAGFLLWNRPPARIFMGDVGSYLVGFELAAFTLIEHNAGGRALLWLILFLPFVVDATMTLLRRMARGERWWTAHRSHAYQRLVLSGWSPRRLLLAQAAVNLGLCWPLAWWAAAVPAAAPMALTLGALVLLALWVVVVASRGQTTV